MVRSEIVRVRLTVEEKVALDRLCGGGCSGSAVIRGLFRDRCALPALLSAAEQAALKSIALALERIGGDLRWAVRIMNEGASHYEPAMFAALVAVLNELDALRQIVDGCLRSTAPERARANHDV